MWASLLVWLVAGLVTPAEARRVALLVGNEAYEAGRLTYPAQDVAVMRQALRAAGFADQDIVTERNADQRRLRRAIQDFGRRASGADVALFYYSGHGAQVLGQNWLVPVGADIHTEGGYELEAVPAQAVLTQLTSARPRVGIVVLDACRDNPQAVSRTGTKGLARMEAGDRTLIAFATAPNDTAADTGLYARVLASQLQTPGLELLDAFRNTTAEVRRQTAGRQVPRVSEVTLDERVVLMPVAPVAAHLAPAPQPGASASLRIDDIEAEQRARQQTEARLARMQLDFDRPPPSPVRRICRPGCGSASWRPGRPRALQHRWPTTCASRHSFAWPLRIRRHGPLRRQPPPPRRWLHSRLLRQSCH